MSLNNHPSPNKQFNDLTMFESDFKIIKAFVVP